MNRIYLKERAKQVLRNDFWYLAGIVLICAFLTMQLIGIETKVVIENGISQTLYYFKIFNITVNFDPRFLAFNIGFIILALRVLVGFVIRPLVEYGQSNVFKYASLDRRDFNLFEKVNENYLNIIKVNVISYIIIGLYTLAFIVPGIMKALELRYINEILEEHPDWDYKEVFAESKQLTSGLKMDLFILDLSFFGWYLVVAVVNLLTLGLATYALTTYTSATNAEAYLWIKETKGMNNMDVEVSYMQEEEVL